MITRALTLTTALFLCQPTFGIFEIGAGANYFSQSLTSKATSTSGAQSIYNLSFGGALFNGYGHVTFGVPSLVTFGIGPEIGFASQSSSDYYNGANKEEMSYFRFGLDTKLQLESIPGVSPYLRLTLGKDSISWTEEGKVGTASFQFKSSGGGFYYNALAGIQIPLAPLFALYLQAGITGSPASDFTLKTFTLNGVSQSFVQTNTVANSYTGFIAGAGARLSF